MPGPPVAVAVVRRAVRVGLADVPAGSVVVVACSGGADSLALFAATMFEARAAGWLVGLVTVDHRLQPGSQQRAERLAGWARSAGADPAEVLTVDAGGSGGLEASARAARYAALDGAASRHDAAAVLLGHPLDDQAETVLL
ncbi:MAG: ATP-binding protein [Mycobacteriales bacterium]